jgi:hypothetical protein
MAIYKTGTITGTGAAINLNLGFVPSRIRLLNITTLTSGVGIFDSEWFYGMTNATAHTITTAGIPVHALTAANGFTPYQTGDAALWTATNITITGISAAAQAVVTAANSLALGDVVTFHGVVGMTQINGLRGKVVALGGGAAFTVDINTTAFTAYASGGIANLISNTQYNVGQIGMTLGTSVAGAVSDEIFYEAYLNTPVTS